MGKPDSIRKFDWLYLGSIAVGLIGLALSWSTVTGQMDAQMEAAGTELGSGTATAALIGGLVIGTGVSLAIWFLISVLRIELIKWVLIVLVLWGLVTLPAGIQATGGIGMQNITGIISTIMSIAAIWFLFRPDAKAWFAEKRGGNRD